MCPWWFAYTFDNFLRRIVHDPPSLLAPYVSEGMVVLDVGCGMGHFSIGMARMVGPRGVVHALDLQQKMLTVLMNRAAREGVAGRIVPHRCTSESLGFALPVNFALLFWMAHEVPDPRRLFDEVFNVLDPSGRLFIAEPSFHVSRSQFAFLLESCVKSGFHCLSRPSVRFSRAAVLGKEPSHGGGCADPAGGDRGGAVPAPPGGGTGGP